MWLPVPYPDTHPPTLNKPQVSIAHLLRYFWGAALGIAPLVLVTACAFDFYDISKSKYARGCGCARVYGCMGAVRVDANARHIRVNE